MYERGNTRTKFAFSKRSGKGSLTSTSCISRYWASAHHSTGASANTPNPNASHRPRTATPRTRRSTCTPKKTGSYASAGSPDQHSSKHSIKHSSKHSKR